MAEPQEAAGSAVRRVSATPAFASWIDGYVVPDHERLNAELLQAVIAWRAEGDSMQSSNRLGWHSTRDLFERREPAFGVLAAHIRAAMEQSIRRYWPEFDPERHSARWDGWANINGPGAFNGPHGHSANHLSGSYYVTTSAPGDHRSGALEFLNPAGAVTQLLPFGRKLLQTDLRVRPKPGQMLIFPSYLRHWVYPNLEDEERVSIAFNVLITAENIV